MINNKKTFWIIVGILIALTFAVSYFGYDLAYEKTIKESKSSNAGSDTSNWKTYKNEKYGFEVRYPDNWVLETNAAGSLFFSESKWLGRNYDSAVNFVGITSFDFASIPETLKMVYLKDRRVAQSEWEIDLGMLDRYAKTVIFLDNPKLKVDMTATDDNYKKIEEKILESFKFTNTTSAAVDTSNWKAYKNEFYGFEIKYPKNTEILEAYDGITFVFPDKQRQLDVRLTADVGDNECHKTTWAGEVPSISLDNIEFWGIGCGLKCEPYDEVQYCAINNGTYYKIFARIIYETEEQNFVQSDSMLNEIISTFKFTK